MTVLTLAMRWKKIENLWFIRIKIHKLEVGQGFILRSTKINKVANSELSSLTEILFRKMKASWLLYFLLPLPQEKKPMGLKLSLETGPNDFQTLFFQNMDIQVVPQYLQGSHSGTRAPQLGATFLTFLLGAFREPREVTHYISSPQG